MAELTVNLTKLKHNVQKVRRFCETNGLEVVGIVKGCFAYPPIIKTFQENGIERLGISRVTDAENISSHTARKPMMIGLPLPEEAMSVVRYFKSSLNSEIETIRALAEAADRNELEHEILLMVEDGDLREGVMPEDVLKTVRSILEIKSRYLRFGGLGTNLGCCSGTLPDEANMNLLQEIAMDIEKHLGYPVKTISIGGSVILDWMERHHLPSKINQIRIGEVILLGYNTNVNRRHKDLFDDVFTIKGQVLEVKEKPSVPWGIQGVDAFGKTPQFENYGIRRRAILNFGIVDTEPSGTFPMLRGIELINSNSNYTIADVTNCEQRVKPGDSLEFKINYSAMIRVFLSPYTRIKVQGEA